MFVFSIHSKVNICCIGSGDVRSLLVLTVITLPTIILLDPLYLVSLCDIRIWVINRMFIPTYLCKYMSIFEDMRVTINVFLVEL